MIDFRDIMREAEKAQSKILDTSNKQIEILRKDYETKIVRLTEEAQAKGKEAINLAYGDCSVQLFSALTNDYNIMNSRSNLLTFSEEDMEKALKAREIINKIPQANPELIQQLLVTLGLKPELMGVIQGNVSFEPAQITSYVGNNDACYILSPICDKRSLLSTGLEARLLSITGVGKIDNQMDVSVSRFGNVEAGINRPSSFQADLDLANGFLELVLHPTQGKYAHEIQKALVDKINEIQPEGFKEAGLTHRVQEVDHNILNYFMNNSVKSSEVIELSSSPLEGIEEIDGEPGYAEGATGRYSMKRTLNRSLKFKVKTSEERREVALNRLSDYKPGKEMTNRQIQRVLGYRTPQAITLSIKAGSLTGKTPEAVEEFIRTYTPKRGSWIKPNAKSE